MTLDESKDVCVCICTYNFFFIWAVGFPPLLAEESTKVLNEEECASLFGVRRVWQKSRNSGNRTAIFILCSWKVKTVYLSCQGCKHTHWLPNYGKVAERWVRFRRSCPDCSTSLFNRLNGRRAGELGAGDRFLQSITGQTPKTIFKKLK